MSTPRFKHRRHKPTKTIVVATSLWHNIKIEVPEEVVEQIGSGKRPLVRVTIGEYTYRSAVASMDGKSMISLSAENQKAAGVEGGDAVDVTIELDLEQQTVVTPVNRNVTAVLPTIPRSAVPDMPDRIIAATAAVLQLPLITRDHLIRLSGLHTVW